MKACVSTIVLATLVIMSVFLLQSDEQSTPEPAAAIINHNHNHDDDAPRGTVFRSDLGSDIDTALHWSEQLNQAAEFQRLFDEDFITNGGDEELVQYVLDATREMKTVGNWNRVQENLAALEDRGMAFSELSYSLFEDVLFVEYQEVGNLLFFQKSQWDEWLKARSDEHFHFPSLRMENSPLYFPPEMHLAQLTGENGGREFSADLLLEAAMIRDQAIRNYAALELERYLMIGSINQVIKDMKINIPLEEWDEAVSSFLPPYLNVIESKKEIGHGYAMALSILLVTNGYDIP
jgi:hypothetical protein